MKTVRIVALIALVGAVSTAASAQSRGGIGSSSTRGRSTTSRNTTVSRSPQKTLTALSKTLLSKIKLTNPQKDSLKEITARYVAKQTELIGAARGTGGRGGGSGGGGNGRGGGDRGGPVGGLVGADDEAQRREASAFIEMYADLEKWYVEDLRAMLTAEQATTFDKNRAEYDKKQLQQLQRGRGGAA
jgi:Spy/CpxP family protein refolding chaperone